METQNLQPAPGQVPGTNTNNNAPAGTVGEIIESTVATGAAVVLVTATAKDVTSITLTPGDWDVSGAIDFKPAATTSVTVLKTSLSTVLDTLNTQAGGAGIDPEALDVWNQAANVPAADVSVPIGPVRVSVAANTVIHLVASATFTVAAMNAYGTIRARRMR